MPGSLRLYVYAAVAAIPWALSMPAKAPLANAATPEKIMPISNRRQSLSMQIIGSLLFLLGVVLVGLVLVGRNAVSMADATAAARQERFAARYLAAEIARLPEEQRSVTIWDDAVQRTTARDDKWMDANLGPWMWTYFGHSESYVLDRMDEPFYASVMGERRPPSSYGSRADAIAPLVGQLRASMAETSAGLDNPYEELAELSVSAPLRFGTDVAIVSVVPIISDTGELPQTPGTESLHVAVRYVDEELAQRIGAPIELQAVAFGPAPPARGMTGIQVTDPAGEAIAWLTWKSERPGMVLVMRMLPILIATGMAGAFVLWWIIHRLLRVSGQLQVSEAQARFLAHHDALTGLPNRALFQDRLAQEMHAMGRSGRSVALITVDLDRFKQINDSLGHPAGDELIRQVGSRLVALVRAGDTVARFGGDEFMILLSGVADDEALRDICAKVVADLSRPYKLLGKSGNIGASAGAVRARAAGEDAEGLLQRADIALYQAKAEGRGRFCLFTEDAGNPGRQPSQIESDLRAALETGVGLKLVYQPFWDEKGRVTGAEALCRWDHPEHGALSPEIFVRVAEERGLIDQLGQHVLEQACRFAARTNLAKIAVNMSPLQLRNPDFVAMVLRTLETSGLAASRLELELTEKAVLEQTSAIEDTISRLRAAGITIALDDFATGKSSLQYLRDHRIDSIKIDRTFIARLGKDDDCDHLVRAIFGLARAMRISVTVEGVETELQHSLLASMGCKTFQGFLLHRPMAPEGFEEVLRNENREPAPA